MTVLNTHIFRKKNVAGIFIFVATFFIVAMCLFGSLEIKTAHGAKYYFDVSKKTVQTSNMFEVVLMLDTEEETINAIEGSVSFSRNLILKQIHGGNSLVGLWVEPPTAEGDHVVFAGIIPGGYLGELGPNWEGARPCRVFSLLFEAGEEGDAWIQVDRESTVLLHDGKGTEAHVTVEDTNVKVLKGEETPSSNIIDWEDKERPEQFTPSVELFSDGLYYLIFVTRDKGLGVAYYDVREGEGSFTTAKSPYLLKEQCLGVPIMVRAVDKNGNKRLVFLSPEVRPVWYESIKTRVILFSMGIIIISFIFIFVFRSRWRRSVK